MCFDKLSGSSLRFFQAVNKVVSCCLVLLLILTVLPLREVRVDVAAAPNYANMIRDNLVGIWEFVSKTNVYVPRGAVFSSRQVFFDDGSGRMEAYFQNQVIRSDFNWRIDVPNMLRLVIHPPPGFAVIEPQYISVVFHDSYVVFHYDASFAVDVNQPSFSTFRRVGDAPILRPLPDGAVLIRTAAELIIENSYVTNNINALAVAPVFGRPDSNSGSLVGSGGSSSIRGTLYRINTQLLSVNRGSFPAFASGNTNTNGITATLSSTQMRNHNSFVGWDFNQTWVMVPTRNNGFPFLHSIVQGFAPQRTIPVNRFIDDFSAIQGSDTSITLGIYMPYLSLIGTYVNGSALLQDTHFTVEGGSTFITLLPGFLNTLEDGFHTLTVTFAGDVTVENQFLIIEAHETEGMTVDKLYLEDMLVFSINDGGLLVDEDFFELLSDGNHNLRSFPTRRYGFHFVL